MSPNPDQPRRELEGEALLALAESIKARGLLQPIVVRALPGGSYELIAGERRMRAARLAGLDTVPAVIRRADESDRLELALIENMAREELNPVDSARACATLVQDLGVTKEELGRRLGRSRVAISNLIRLLDLPDEALDLIASGDLSEGHGRALLMSRDQADRRRLAREASAKGWSVRETERRARGEAVGPRKTGPAQPTGDTASPRSSGRDRSGRGRTHGGARGGGARPSAWRSVPGRARARPPARGDRAGRADPPPRSCMTRA